MTEQDTAELNDGDEAVNSPEPSNSHELNNSPEPENSSAQGVARKHATGRYVIVVIAMLICASVFYRSIQPSDPAPSVNVPVSHTADVSLSGEQTSSELTQDSSQEPTTLVTAPPSFKVAEERKNTRQRLVDVVLSPAEQARRVELAKQQAESEQRASDAKLKMLETRLSPDHDELESLSKVEVSYAVEQWRKAWSRGDAERYFSAYSDSFTPSNKQDIDAWKASRLSALSADKALDLTLSGFEVSFDEAMSTGTVTFKQRIGAKDTRKQLVLGKEVSVWKIVSESPAN